MFGDRSVEAVSFDSQLSIAKSQLSANVQTTEIVYNERPAQTVETRTIETQTVTGDEREPKVNYDRLAEFLNRVTPNVLEALDESYGTDAFDDYEPNTDEESVAGTRLLQTIKTTGGSDSQMKMTDMCWSIGGGTLVVSYGVTQHRTWCEHLSKIVLYERTRQGGTFADEPSKTLEANGCVTAMAHHPTEPSIVAVGLFNGDVVVWNLREDASSAPATVVCTHDDSVTGVHWNARTANGDVSLLTTSGKDGHILVHKMTANHTIARAFKRLKVAKEHDQTESSRTRSAGGTREARAVEPGSCVTTFDFSSKDPMFFVVGTLSGGLYKCTMDPVVPTVQGDDATVDPVIAEYERYEGGSVTCVRCSPTRSIFVAAGTDKEIRIYDFEKHDCLHSISSENTIIGLTWMTWNRDILATYGVGPKIGLYDVTDGRLVTNANFESPDRQNSSCLCVDPNENLVAIGDTRGNLEIWKVPRRL
ncbi:WD repeat-containing protein 34-like [Ceratina calcarata]|uniref:WD repeat-containing protein 34-like n=1 Tax=Ceratina calcarata TaxID=156304 RepID=A0AAJ7J7W4_9HYME|nr:WD repeat-containing protein 34-like [Ceratina calcarata]